MIFIEFLSDVYLLDSSAELIASIKLKIIPTYPINMVFCFFFSVGCGLIFRIHNKRSFWPQKSRLNNIRFITLLYCFLFFFFKEPLWLLGLSPRQRENLPEEFWNRSFDVCRRGDISCTRAWDQRSSSSFENTWKWFKMDAQSADLDQNSSLQVSFEEWEIWDSVVELFMIDTPTKFHAARWKWLWRLNFWNIINPWEKKKNLETAISKKYGRLTVCFRECVLETFKQTYMSPKGHVFKGNWFWGLNFQSIWGACVCFWTVSYNIGFKPNCQTSCVLPCMGSWGFFCRSIPSRHVDQMPCCWQ